MPPTPGEEVNGITFACSSDIYTKLLIAAGGHLSSGDVLFTKQIGKDPTEPGYENDPIPFKIHEYREPDAQQIHELARYWLSVWAMVVDITNPDNHKKHVGDELWEALGGGTPGGNRVSTIGDTISSLLCTVLPVPLLDPEEWWLIPNTYTYTPTPTTSDQQTPLASNDLESQNKPAEESPQPLSNLTLDMAHL